LEEFGHTARSMALRLVFGWIGLNLGALLLLAVVDFFRVASKRLARLIAKPQTVEPQP
jgi:hypothetical protein